ncbi:hypothetical protein EXIGLDRAFT_771791 [Exidia glandulosa HHB12029]|uniref:BTB domain-containing protein n=1 Tax=Exidia glandulosa HHB12029 TaxID=1314781 RepID=A0A165FS22_EXIGL|nr:hypothetical protein EXIGLDRAFT_771791 [Exidia glandulosa HHB12029]
MASFASSSSSSSSSMAYSSSRPPARHASYYFEDGNTVLLVGDVLFRLHRTILSRNSTLFRSMLSLPQGADVTEGTIDEDPIILADYDPHDFELLLDMIYTSPTATMVKSLDDWRSILDIAHKLEVEWIHERAFAEMARMPLEPVDKVVIAQRFDDKRHLVREAYVVLVRRENALTIEEAQRIGLIDSTRLAHARELFREHLHVFQLQNMASGQPAPSGRGGGVLRRASAAPRHSPYSIPYSYHSVSGGSSSGGSAAQNIIQQMYAGPPQPSQQQLQQQYQQQQQQAGAMHSIAHGLASSLAPVLASASAPQMYQYPPPAHSQQLPQLQLAQSYYQLAPTQQHQPQPGPSSSAVAMGITQPARMLMPYNFSQFDQEAQLQAIAEQCVDAVFGFNTEGGSSPTSTASTS